MVNTRSVAVVHCRRHAMSAWAYIRATVRARASLFEPRHVAYVMAESVRAAAHDGGTRVFASRSRGGARSWR